MFFLKKIKNKPRFWEIFISKRFFLWRIFFQKNILKEEKEEEEEEKCLKKTLSNLTYTLVHKLPPPSLSCKWTLDEIVVYTFFVHLRFFYFYENCGTWPFHPINLEKSPVVVVYEGCIIHISILNIWIGGSEGNTEQKQKSAIHITNKEHTSYQYTILHG